MTKTTKPARSLADVAAMATPRQATVRICVAGHLAAEADRLQAELDALGARYVPTSLADVDPRAALESELAEVHDQMRGAEVEFRFQALGPQDWSDLVAAHPGRTEEEAWNPETFAPALTHACLTEPAGTAEELEALMNVLNDRQLGELWGTAFRANRGDVKVPFSPAASPATSSSGEK